MHKTAPTDAPILNTLAVRWSPYVFSPRPVRRVDLQSLFEAARWAASSYNEQPWRFIVGVRGQGDTHARVLSCLTEKNQAWARAAPVLAIGVFMRNLASSGEGNRAAQHDLGLASANLAIEATRRKLHVHMMIGIDPDAAREAFSIPEDAEALTAMAIGYHETELAGGSALRKREASPRSRHPLDEFVFGDHFGQSADL
ncbi:MAG: nitroreductase family protein [Salinisphaera sp.]|jgi:nitroreductase|nr:nitroreductase family protein [Salinisphaera sp.]